MTRHADVDKPSKVMCVTLCLSFHPHATAAMSRATHFEKRATVLSEMNSGKLSKTDCIKTSYCQKHALGNSETFNSRD